MKAHKVTVLVVDHDEVGAAELFGLIERARFPNDCVHPRVVSVEAADIEWHDRHPFNLTTKQRNDEFARVFGGAK